MQHFFLPYKSSLISYYTWGTGDRKLICFHGYGENALSFGLLAPHLPDCQVVAIDMPFHGETKWEESGDLLPETLMHIVQQICGNKQERISLMGYSMGGRVCMQLVQLSPDLVDRLVLLAPDGFHRNPWYNVATQTIIGNRLFRFSMEHPAPLFTLMKMMSTAGLLQPAVNKIAHYYLDKEEERMLLYRRWTLMRRFKVASALLRKQVATNKIKVRMLFGKYDKIIISNNALPLVQGLEDLVHINIIEAGHQLLKEKHIQEVASLMYE
ncbi:alpha/beta hydrolase [Danxiaibacter flavus]|uniref:Alpha/beta hydrolase n=1 Tax=Danxiaibacter flavus TaxID=3049108 RepID=A0ABV3ZKM3_9BACT|nr:alpha/beta hydrolase [Chitinophagaceae bacterium DXS]